MTTLREAATQALEAMDKATRFMSDSDYRKLNEAIDALKAALVEDAMQKFTDVNQELEAALAEPDWQDLYLKEKKRADMWRDKYESVAGAEQRIHPLAEPVQEPVWVCPDSAEHRYGKPGHCEDCGKTLVQVAEPVQQGCDHCNHPLYAATRCRVCGRETIVIANNPPQTFMSYQEGYAAGVVAEREACATFLERVVDLSHLNKHRVWQKYTADLLANCATAIRARSNR